MKTEQFYYYLIDYRNIKSEYLINDLYHKADQTDKRKIASVIGPINENVEEINLNVCHDINIIKIDEDAFLNCKSLKRIIVPDSIIYVERNSFPLRAQIIVNNREYSVDEYLQYITKSNTQKLISDIKLILPWINKKDRVIKIIKKSKTTPEAEVLLGAFLKEKTKMSEYDIKKAVSLMLALKLQIIVSLNYDILKKKINDLEMGL
jgi:hypothetical protein